MNDREFEKQLEALKDSPEMGANFDMQKLWDRFAQENDFPKSNEAVNYGFRDYLEFYVWQFSHTIAMPVAASVAVFVLLLTGLAGANSASFNALPGEKMYSTKLTLEKLQLATAFSSAQKAKLQVEFASRRLEEMVALTATQYQNDASVRLAVNQFKKEVENIQADLKQEKTELAKEVGRKASDYQKTVADSSVNLSEDIKQEVDEVQQILEDTKNEAVEVIITAHETTEDAEAAQELQKAFEEEVAALQAKDLTDEQKQKIETAIELQKEGAYRRAFQLLREIQ